MLYLVLWFISVRTSNDMLDKLDGIYYWCTCLYQLIWTYSFLCFNEIAERHHRKKWITNWIRFWIIFLWCSDRPFQGVNQKCFAFRTLSRASSYHSQRDSTDYQHSLPVRSEADRGPEVALLVIVFQFPHSQMKYEEFFWFLESASC